MSVVDAFTVGAVVVGSDKRRIQLTDRDTYDWYLRELPEGLCVNVTIASDDALPPPRERQKAYWFGVVVPACAKHFKTTDRQMSRDLLVERFGFESGALGWDVPAKASISWLTAEEISGLIEWVRAWVLDRGVGIPAPEQKR